jgi:hypothetical protein
MDDGLRNASFREKNTSGTDVMLKNKKFRRKFWQKK